MRAFCLFLLLLFRKKYCFHLTVVYLYQFICLERLDTGAVIDFKKVSAAKGIVYNQLSFIFTNSDTCTEEAGILEQC